MFGLFFAGVAAVAPAAEAQQTGATPATVLVHGTVYDSLTRTPLAGAHITFAPAAAPNANRVETTTTAGGTFDISVPRGRWIAGIEHPRLDSLGVDPPTRTVDVPARSQFTIALATPSSRTLVRAFCGLQPHAADIALVGMVHAVGAPSGVDSAQVVLQWVELTLVGGRFTRTLASRAARTDANGWYVLCGVPAGAEVMARAERGSSTTGAIVTRVGNVPTRLDIALDISPRNADPSVAPTARFRVIVRDLAGRPLPNARARTLGNRYAVTDAHGIAELDSLPSGSQTLEILALGYVPDRRVVDVGTDAARTDTVVLASLESVLDTIRVTAGRDAIGFNARRQGKVGQFITAADIERENPPTTTWLLRARDGVRSALSRTGVPSIAVTSFGSPCAPYIFMDGYLQAPTPSMPGRAALDWAVHPDEIGGVEIFTNPAEIPSQFAIWTKRECGAILFWTREKLGMPKAEQKQPSPNEQR